MKRRIISLSGPSLAEAELAPAGLARLGDQLVAASRLAVTATTLGITCSIRSA